MTAFDAAIVGAGIVGAATAAALAREGLKVIIIDANGVGTGTTAAGMGHIVVMDDSEAQFALTRYSQTLWDAIAPDLPQQSEFENCGTIWVAADEDEMAEAARKQAFYQKHGISSEVLDSKDLIEAEPNLREGLAGGLQVESDSVVYQLVATRFLVDHAQQNGSELKVGSPAVEINEDGVRLGDGEFIAAGSVINAAGSGAADLTPELKISKRKGHLVITDRYPAFARHQLIELGYIRSAHGAGTESVAFNLQPRGTGQMLLGSSRQFGADDDTIDHDLLRKMTSRAFEYMPALRQLSALRVWTGFRPATPDNLPYIGKLPGHNNIYIAAGHEGLGITTALGTAELVADAILGRESSIPAGPYSPGRTINQH